MDFVKILSSQDAIDFFIRLEDYFMEHGWLMRAIPDNQSDITIKFGYVEIDGKDQPCIRVETTSENSNEYDIASLDAIGRFINQEVQENEDIASDVRDAIFATYDTAIFFNNKLIHFVFE